MTAAITGQHHSRTQSTNTLGSAYLDLSVVIITLNEEKNLPRCLRSLPQGSEIIILDSGSTDQTVTIAESHGALTSSRPFDHYSNQKNAALAKASRSWVLSIDADEELSSALRARIQELCSEPTSCSAFYIKRSLIFMNKRLRFGKTNDYPLRFFRNHSGQFKNEIHEVYTLDNRSEKIGLIKAPLLHRSYEHLTDYFNRFNNYTSVIAQNHYASGKRNPMLLGLCLRPWLEFANRYILRLGWLDGYPGFCYALVSAFYTFVKYAKLRELYAHALDSRKSIKNQLSS